jgi:regulator of protease activity HflC (stomatin/prohibitin superfamily)
MEGIYMGSGDQELVEKIIKPVSGMLMLIVTFVLLFISILLIVIGILFLKSNEADSLGIVLLYIGLVYLSVSWLPFLGLKKLKSQEVLVFTFFGKYKGNLYGEGFFFVNPFANAFGPVVAGDVSVKKEEQGVFKKLFRPKNVISLKDMTFNSVQKVDDELGNPVEVSIVVIWHVVNPAKAVFAVENYKEYLSRKIEKGLKDIFRLYPYDLPGDIEGKTLMSSSQEILDRFKVELEKKVNLVGIEIIEAKINYLA